MNSNKFLYKLKIAMQTTSLNNNTTLRIITAIGLGAIFWTTFFYYPPHVFSILLMTILGIIVTIEWKNIFPVTSFYFWAIMPLYPIAPFLMLIDLNESAQYRILIVYLFAIVFCFDSASYAVGNIYGKHKIIPSISPGKSWQGAWGGYCATTILIIITTDISWYKACLLSLVVCSLAFAGDIFESYLKRSAKIKDSGHLLPGHGGFLDRFDAVMAVAVFFYVWKNSLLAIIIKKMM